MYVLLQQQVTHSHFSALSVECNVGEHPDEPQLMPEQAPACTPWDIMIFSDFILALPIAPFLLVQVPPPTDLDPDATIDLGTKFCMDLILTHCR